MDANGKTLRTGEISMTENKRSGEVAVSFSTEERDTRTPRGVPESPNRKSVDSYIDNPVFMPSPNRPPKIPIPDTLTRRKTLNRSVYSKPKSRFGEQPVIDHNMFDQMSEPIGQYSNSPNRIASNHASPRVGGNASPLGTPRKDTIRSISITTKTPLIGSPGNAGGVDEDEEIYKKVSVRKKLKLKRVKMKVLFEWVMFLLLMGCVAASLTINELKQYEIWSLELWKWFVLLSVIICALFNANDVKRSKTAAKNSRINLPTVKKKGKESKTKEVIDVSKLHQIKREKVSALTMKTLVDVISNSGLSTFSGAIEESAYENPSESADKEINNEMEAIAAAYHIFRNVAQPGFTYIEDLDLRRFMIKEEVDMVFPMIDVAEKGQIDRKTLTEWVVKVYNGRKALAHALSDTKTAVNQLNKLVTAVLIIVVIVVWLLLTEIATTKILVLLSSQLVVAAFIFGNTCKTIFEAIVFVFIMHPFDVGDRCCIDGVQLIVEEMNILTTVFLRYDNEKIYYPNSVLSTKPISNFYRSPDMGDSVEFSIDFATSIEKIGQLKEKIKKYLEKNPQLWHPNHNFVVKEIENVNKIKMALFFNHTMNFQDYGEKNKRRSELVLELKKFFEDLKIKCNLLPQEVHLNRETTIAGPTK
nr:mechanosensitive ion channel protein 10-like [Tanacetum cinerariifolium]